MVRSRDPPAFNATRRGGTFDYSSNSHFDRSTELKYNKNHDKYTSMEASNRAPEEMCSGSSVETELDPVLIDKVRQCIHHYQSRELQVVERQLGLKLAPPGMSFGEDEAMAQEAVCVSSGPPSADESLTERSDSTMSSQESYSRHDQPTMFFTSFENASAEDEEEAERTMMVLLEAAGDDVGSIHHQRKKFPGFWVGLFEFLTCALTSICTTPKVPTDMTGILEYEMPLRSVVDVDDIGTWGRGDEEQESLKPTKIAKAIDFSSKRVDNENACIALYDEVKLKQEVLKVAIPEEYFDYDDGDEDAFGEPSYMATRNVPDAVVVQPKKADEVSVLEDNSALDSMAVTRKIKAWSLSPRRKQKLEEKAKAIAMKRDI